MSGAVTWEVGANLRERFRGRMGDNRLAVHWAGRGRGRHWPVGGVRGEHWTVMAVPQSATRHRVASVVHFWCLKFQFHIKYMKDNSGSSC